MEIDTNKTVRLLDIESVSQATTLGKSTIRLWESQERFPKSIKLSQSKRVWIESEINDWILSKSQSAPINTNHG